MKLTKQRIRDLRSDVHHLKPVVLLGQNGLTEAVQQEIERALDDHELIKIRLSGAEREERKQLAEAICHACGAELIHSIGHIIAIYRKNPNKS